MLEEITVLYELPVYTDKGVLIGPVANVSINMDTNEIESLVIEESNENVVEEARPVSVPYRWVQCVGDIIILRHFPARIELTEAEKAAMKWE